MDAGLTAREELSNVRDVFRVVLGAGLVVFSGDEKAELFAGGNVVDDHGIVLSSTLSEILAPFDGRGGAQGFAVKERDEDFVAVLRRSHCSDVDDFRCGCCARVCG